MTYLPDLMGRRQVPIDGEALAVRLVPGGGAVSAFGTLVTSQESAIVELQFPYGLLAEHLTLSGANGGYISSSQGMAIVNSGTGSIGYASLESKSANHYVSGMGGRFKFAGRFASGGLAQSMQEVGIGDTADGFFFGYSGSLFGVCRRARGEDFWVAQTSWSLDPMDGRGPSGQVLDPIMGNVYMITYQWLGFGAITYHVEDSATGMFFPVHRITYANQNLLPSIADPNLPLRIAARNWGSTGSVAPAVSSMCAMVEGILPAHGIRRAEHDLATGVSAEVPLLTIMNSETFNGRTNRMRVKVDMLSVASRDGSNQTTYRLVANATLTNANFTAVSASNSPVTVDKSATAMAGGREMLFVGVGPNASHVIDLAEYVIRMPPGETLTVSASGSSSTVVASLSWIEEL